MKFNLDASPTYALPVAIPFRLEDGSTKDVTVTFRVKRLDQDEYAEMFDRWMAAINPAMVGKISEAVRDGTLSALVAEIEENPEIKKELLGKKPYQAMRDELRKVIVDWNPGDFDPPIDYSEDNRDKLMRFPGAVQSIWNKLGDSIPVAKQKNSQRSP